MAGIRNEIIYGSNVDFTGNPIPAGQITSNGQILIGSSSGPALQAGFITGSGGITVTNGPGTINISGGGVVPSSESFALQSGTTPVVPNGAGQVTFNGAVISAGTTPVKTFGSGVNTMVLQVQTSQSVAATDPTKIGLSNYNNTQFTVDANGFVSLVGSSTNPPVFSISVNSNTAPGTNPVIPSAAGAITIDAQVVAAHSVPIETRSRAANAFNIEVQESAAVAATDVTKSGISHFNSAQFTVDANGFVSTSGTGPALTLTGNTGTAVSPTTGNINTVGTGSITIAGNPGTSTLTTQLTGLTNHAIQIGAGTATLTQLGSGSTGQILQTNTSNDPTWSTATYPSIATGTGTILRADGTNWIATTATYPATTTINDILYSSANNTISQITAANQSVLTSSTTGVPTWVSMATDGKVLIGSTAGNPAAAVLTPGTGITITNGSNSITISASSSGFTWTDVTTAIQTIAAENGYITDRGGGVTYTLPASGSLGDTFKIVGKAGIATITPLALQQLLIGSASGTVGVTGTAVSTNAGDCIEFVCITSGASTVWRSSSFVGNWTLS